MTTYKVMDFQFEEGEYLVEGQAEISIFKDGDGSGREYMTHAVEYVDIDRVTDEDENEISFEGKSLEELQDIIAEKILELDLDYSEETVRDYGDEY
jgi:hypothetical protein